MVIDIPSNLISVSNKELLYKLKSNLGLIDTCVNDEGFITVKEKDLMQRDNWVATSKVATDEFIQLIKTVKTLEDLIT